MNHPQTPYAMNAKFSTLFAFFLMLGSTAASAQGAQLYSPRGGSFTVDNGPRITEQAQILKGIGTRPTDNGATEARSNGTFYLKATVLIQGPSKAGNTKRLMFAKGRTKKEALSNLRDQVNAIGANARVVRIQFFD